MRGLILAGGLDSRLSPPTLDVCKPLISVYHKPMIYYPLSVLLLAGIKDMLIISTPHETPLIQQLLGDGSKWGINLSYAVQPTSQGVAQAFIIGAEFIGNQSSTLILGDNIFCGDDFADSVQNAIALKKGARIFAYAVNNPEKYAKKYGVVVFDESGKVCDLQENSQATKSEYAVTGLYFYDSSVAQRARSLPFYGGSSTHGELAMTELNKTYLDDGLLQVNVLARGTSWFDVGGGSLLDAEKFIETVEKRQGVKVGCPEEICWRKGYIDDCQLEHLAEQMKTGEMEMNDYGKYLKGLLAESMTH